MQKSNFKLKNMNALERDKKLQEINQYLIKSRNAIRRKKDGIAMDKLSALEALDDDYIAKKRFYIEKIDDLRKQKCQFDYDNPRRSELEDQARHNEHLLSLLRNEHERNIHKINNEHMAKRIELDNEDRCLSEQYEHQKNAITLEYLKTNDETYTSETQYKAE